MLLPLKAMVAGRLAAVEVDVGDVDIADSAEKIYATKGPISPCVEGGPRITEGRAIADPARLTDEYQPRSFRRVCGAELACAIAATEACSRTWALERLAASCATLASLMPDSAAEKLVICEFARLVA